MAKPNGGCPEMILIRGGDDGIEVDRFTQEELIRAFREGELDPSKAILTFPGDCDANYWGDHYLILKVDRVVAPHPKEVITDWELR